MIKINGDFFNYTEIPLVQFLEDNGYRTAKIAVERNEEIVPKAKYDECILRDGDVVEIVSFVGGG